MASAMPVENWGQLKLVDVNNNSNNSNSSNDENDSEGAASVHIQLLSLPKGEERERATYVPRTLLSIPVSAIASASGTTRNDVSLVLRPHSSVSRDGDLQQHATTTGNNSSNNNSSSSSHAVAVELTGVRFAVPNICVGYEQTDEAGKVILQEVQQQMQAEQRRLLQSHARQRGDGGAATTATTTTTSAATSATAAGTAAATMSDDANLLLLAALGSAGARADERAVAVFDDITLSYPAGKYKMVVSNYHVVLEDKKRGASSGLATLALSSVQQLYLCDVPTHFAKASSNSSSNSDAEQQTLGQYVVLILKAPLKIRATSYAHLVISCPANMLLDDEHAWQCELQTQEEINRVLGGGGDSNNNNNNNEDGSTKKTGDAATASVALTPRMSGKVSEILVRVFKAVARVPAYGGTNKEYRSVLTQRRHCCMRCLFHGTEGLLYVVNSGFLFLHRPATLLRFDEVDRVEMDEAESGKATFQLNVYCKTAAAAGRGGGSSERVTFSAIDKEEKEGLLAYLSKKGKLVRRGIAADDDDDEDDEEDDDEEDEEDDDSDDDDDSSDNDEDDEDDDDDSGDDRKAKKRTSDKHATSKQSADDADGKAKSERSAHKHRHHKHKHRHHKHRHHKRDRDAAKDDDGDDGGDGKHKHSRKKRRHHHHTDDE